MVKTQKISKQVWIINDQAGYCCNLIIGKERALLFDTGAGIDDLKSSVQQITKLPLIVINSHGHFDHVGGNYQFDTVYLHENDRCILEGYSFEVCDRWIRDLFSGKKIAPYANGYATWENTKPLNFERFDLGELECEIVPLPGHTKGSIGILIPKLRLLLSGDALTPVMCLLFQNHMPVEVQYQTLQMVKQLDFTHYLTSHHTKAFNKAMIERMIDCIEHVPKARWFNYQYPYPPYTKGKIFVDSIGDEAVGLIV